MIYQSLNENPFGIKYPNSGLHCCTKITSMFNFLNDEGSWTSSKTATNKRSHAITDTKGIKSWKI